MKILISAFLFCLFFGLPVFSQEAQKIAIFSKGTPCGDSQGRIDSVSIEYITANSPDTKLYIIYYGGRYRKTTEWNEKTETNNIVKLKYPHRDDGLAWAKSIPVYILRRSEMRELLKDKIVFINGGYRENIEAEIWFVPKQVKVPIPTPTIDEKDVKFLSPKPIRTPDFECCYSDCKAYLYP